MTMPPTAVTARLKENNFDALRLIFAGMVVVFHMGILSQVPALHWLERYISSTFAVQAFFFVSGFLVFMSCERSKSLKDYAAKRFWRIAPAYVLVVTAAALLLASLSTLTPLDYFSSPGFRSYLFYNLLLSNFSAPDLPGVFAGNHEQAINGSLWTIKIEVAFYIAVPLVVWAVRRFGVLKTLTTVFVLSSAWKLGFLLLHETTGKELYFKLSKQLPGQLAFFVGGALAYYRTREGKSPPPVSVGLIGILAYATTDGLFHEAVAPFAVTAIVYWLSVGIPWVVNAGKHGDFSYGLYLYHFPIVQTLIALGVYQQHPWPTAIGVLAGTIVLSVLSWHLYEKRFLRHRAAHPVQALTLGRS
jgi:peptidoglycan/LPS O-acetylase OafA/YrhL